MVAECEPDALESIKPVLLERRTVILDRMERNEETLRETFAALEVLDFKTSFDESVEIVRGVLSDN